MFIYLHSQKKIFRAGVMKLVDMPDLGSGASRRGGSSPSTRTYLKDYNYYTIVILKRDYF